MDLLVGPFSRYHEDMVWIVYGIVCVIWGTTWLAIKFGLHFIPPLTGVGLRFVIGGLFLYGVAACRGHRPWRDVPWKLIAVLALLVFGANYTLIYVAETHLDSGLAAVLFGTTPFFVFGFGHIVGTEKATARIWAGASLALAGVAVATLNAQTQASPVYAVAVLGAAAASAFGSVYAKKNSEHSPLITLPPAMLVAGICLFVFGTQSEHVDWRLAFSPQSLAAVGYLAVFGSGIAFLCYLWMLARLPASIVGLFTLVVPIIALAVGGIFGGEHFTMREALGCAAVVAGIFVALTKGGSEAFRNQSPLGKSRCRSGDLETVNGQRGR